MHFVYILKSGKHNRYYIGCTSNLKRRIDEHNNKKVSSTKAFAPWSIVHLEKYASKSEAFRREKEIKNYKSGYKFQELKKSESWQSGCHHKVRSRFAGNAAVLSNVLCIYFTK